MLSNKQNKPMQKQKQMGVWGDWSPQNGWVPGSAIDYGPDDLIENPSDIIRKWGQYTVTQSRLWGFGKLRKGGY